MRLYCLTCHRSAPPDRRFCGRCGGSLLDSAAAEAQVRQRLEQEPLVVSDCEALISILEDDKEERQPDLALAWLGLCEAQLAQADLASPARAGTAAPVADDPQESAFGKAVSRAAVALHYVALQHLPEEAHARLVTTLGRLCALLPSDFEVLQTVRLFASPREGQLAATVRPALAQECVDLADRARARGNAGTARTLLLFAADHDPDNPAAQAALQGMDRARRRGLVLAATIAGVVLVVAVGGFVWLQRNETAGLRLRLPEELAGAHVQMGMAGTRGEVPLLRPDPTRISVTTKPGVYFITVSLDSSARWDTTITLTAGKTLDVQAPLPHFSYPDTAAQAGVIEQPIPSTPGEAGAAGSGVAAEGRSLEQSAAAPASSLAGSFGGSRLEVSLTKIRGREEILVNGQVVAVLVGKDDAGLRDLTPACRPGVNLIELVSTASDGGSVSNYSVWVDNHLVLRNDGGGDRVRFRFALVGPPTTADEDPVSAAPPAPSPVVNDAERPQEESSPVALSPTSASNISGGNDFTGSSLAVRMFNVDDVEQVLINGQVVLTARYRQDTGLQDLTGKCNPGANDVAIVLRNAGGGYTYGYQVQIDGQEVISEKAGTAGSRGANRNEQRRGLVHERRFRFNLRP